MSKLTECGLTCKLYSVLHLHIAVCVIANQITVIIIMFDYIAPRSFSDHAYLYMRMDYPKQSP